MACEAFDESMKSLLLFRFLRNSFWFRIQSNIFVFFFFIQFPNFSIFLFVYVFFLRLFYCFWAIYRFFFLLSFSCHNQIDCTVEATIDTSTDHTLQWCIGKNSIEIIQMWETEIRTHLSWLRCCSKIPQIVINILFYFGYFILLLCTSTSDDHIHTNTSTQF